VDTHAGKLVFGGGSLHTSEGRDLYLNAADSSDGLNISWLWTLLR
jgi:hypothetical protein